LNSERRQILVFCYHKTGSTLFDRVLRNVAARLGRTVATQYGMVHDIDPSVDIMLLSHSLVGTPPSHPFRGVRIVRDPRDIWVSGYLYHRRCQEAWCTNTDLDPSPPIAFPRVPFSIQHRSEQYKRDYLRHLGGASYQQNLLDRDHEAGLAFELAGYTRCTLEAMRAWQLRTPDIIDVKLETIMRRFDVSMLAIFRHLGLDNRECDAALSEACSEDIARMDDATLAAIPQVYSRTISKWRDLLSAADVAAFERQYGDLITSLGYQLAGQA
jgi:hypothetical protein